MTTEEYIEEEGCQKTKVILYHIDMRLKPYEIAAKMSIPESEVNKILNEHFEHLDRVLSQDAFTMTTGQLIRKKAQEEERAKWQGIIASQDELTEQFRAWLDESKLEESKQENRKSSRQKI